MTSPMTHSLKEVALHLARILARSVLSTPAGFAVSQIRCETVMVSMRDGVRLATDIYQPPTVTAPAVVVRTPYGRAQDAYAAVFLSLARRGYVVIAQDCRGTGDSEPDHWDYYMYESEDGYDCVEWICRQPWFNGFLGSCGGSYVGQMQWQMAMHPCMSTIIPDVSGLGVAVNSMHLHMFSNAYARSVGKGKDKIAVPFYELERDMFEETWATGYFNEPLHKPVSEAISSRYPPLRTLSGSEAKQWLWEYYCRLPCAGRAEFVKQALGIEQITTVDVEGLPAIFGHGISHDRHTLPDPNPAALAERLHVPVLLRTGWYDWGINDALATWALLMEHAPERTRSRCRLFIAPSAHNMPGYHEGMAEHPELHHAYGVTSTVEMLLCWYAAVRDDRLESWPTVIYYLMGANEWRAASAWPIPHARTLALYLAAEGRLSARPPTGASNPDRYVYDPHHPTPTVGGSIVSYVYPPGSVDIRAVQQRDDVLTYTSEVLTEDLEVAGPLRMLLYASSSARDTDFAVRLSDVFPDGRAIQLQNGVLRARYRQESGEPELLEPGRIYRFKIDLWATANCFKAGHQMRLDISSADFPRFDRNANLGGEPGDPVPARQTIFHDAEHPSHLLVQVVSGALQGESP